MAKPTPKGGKNPSQRMSRAGPGGLKELFDEEMAKRGPKPRSPAEGVPEQPVPPKPNAKMLAGEPAIPEDSEFIQRQANKEAAQSARDVGRNAEPAPIDLEKISAEEMNGPKMGGSPMDAIVPENPGRPAGGSRMPFIPPAVGIPGMVAAGMMIPRTTGGGEDEEVIRKIIDQQRALGGGPRNEHDMNSLIASAMGGNAAPKEELYDAIVPGGAGDGNLGGGMAQSAPDISDEELSRMIKASGLAARESAERAGAKPSQGSPGYGDPNGAFGRPQIQQPAEDVMTRLMMEQMRNGTR